VADGFFLGRGLPWLFHILPLRLLPARCGVRGVCDLVRVVIPATPIAPLPGGLPANAVPGRFSPDTVALLYPVPLRFACIRRSPNLGSLACRRIGSRPPVSIFVRGSPLRILLPVMSPFQAFGVRIPEDIT